MTILFSTITCPACGHRKIEKMPVDACQYFYDCEGCHTVLKPKPGHCCVFCSYGDMPCPPIQAAGLDAGKATCCTGTTPEQVRVRDWVSDTRTFAMAWGFPMGLILAGLLAKADVRTVLWSIALAWMGTACILNARRCGRTHCRFTGPYYLAMIIPVLLVGWISVGFYGWLALGAAILAGGKIIWWVTERALGRYS